ncbi:MAG TPA: hypothetical protein VIT67_00450 [Povalibacter sp.]
MIAAGLTANTFQFSTTQGGAAVNTSGIQNGLQRVARTNLEVGDVILAYNGSTIILAAHFDSPTFLSQYKNHLFLGYASGSVLFSSIGEPLQYITTTGAGELMFGDSVTGLLPAAATSLLLLSPNRISYLTGDDASTFVLNPISDTSGAKPYTVQAMNDPMFMDDAGVRSLSTTSAFGDWRMNTITHQIEPLMRQKIAAGIHPIASMQIKAADQYKLFWEDRTGITVYIGRKYPEAMPFKLPIEVYCACSGEVDTSHGDRLFVGCQDGFVYELNRGTSFDGADIDTYIRLPFTTAGSPSQHTRWMKATFELSAPDDINVGVAFDVDYARGLGGPEILVSVEAGSAIITADYFDEIDWTQPIAGRIEHHLSGIGPNVAATLIAASATADRHTISSQTYNFSPRRMKR